MTAPASGSIALVLEDGSVFEGEAAGAVPNGGCARGEVVFNTVMSGYQEVLSDPSYAGQIVTFTSAHIGNYGTNSSDDESARPHARGMVVRDLSLRPSNWRNERSLEQYLVDCGVPAITGVDTRRLTRLLRDAGSLRGAFGGLGEAELLREARAEKGTTGVDLVGTVTTAAPYTVGTGRHRVVAYDFGIKSTILRCLGEIATVTVVPAQTTAEDVRELAPDGVFLSNGPGDPEMCGTATDEIRRLAESGMPVFGICLGHQLLARAFGARTYKLPFGHHGGNHPVRRLATGSVEITSQNHNFCVDPDSLGGVAEVTHVNLNDDTNEGMRILGTRSFSVQYHPEAGPGPHDSRYLFAEFAALMERR